MNFAQLHERLRIEVLRRIDSGNLSSSELARLSGFQPAHISNFLNRKRRLSLDGLDKVLQCQSLTIADLAPESALTRAGTARASAAMNYESVPQVEPSIAALSARIQSDWIIGVVKVRSGLLSGLRDKCSAQRRKWDRFVAVQIPADESALMRPVLSPNATLLIDRHYNSTLGYTPGARNVYAVRHGNRLRFRYAALIERHLVLSSLDPGHMPELIPLLPGRTSADLLVGRVFLTIAEL